MSRRNNAEELEVSVPDHARQQNIAGRRMPGKSKRSKARAQVMRRSETRSGFFSQLVLKRAQTLIVK